MKIKDLLEDRYFDKWAKETAAKNRETARLNAPPRPPKPAKPAKPAPIDLFKVWQDIENVVGNVVPDGDPIDWLAPKLRRLGIDDWKMIDVLDAAVKKHYDKKSSYHDYLADMWDHYNEVVDDEYKLDHNPWRSE